MKRDLQTADHAELNPGLFTCLIRVSHADNLYRIASLIQQTRYSQSVSAVIAHAADHKHRLFCRDAFCQKLHGAQGSVLHQDQ